jgi:hypothetical protein
MEDDTPTPPTQSFGNLVPPPKVPPTALALASPEPLPHRRPSFPELYDAGALQRLIARTFDFVDNIADSVAAGLGLRER